MDISLIELKELIAPDANKPLPKPRAIEKPTGGMCIVIADRGFVWAGNTTVEDDICRIENARNIRTWGTTKGLGELIDGPKESTKLDYVGTVDVPMRAVIGFIKCNKTW